MNYTKNIFTAFFVCTALLICFFTCALVDQQAVAANEAADKALSEAKAAELSKNTKYTDKNEQSKNILEKSMSSLNFAQNALTAADTILHDKNQSTESKTLATEAQKKARQAIKISGSALTFAFS